MRSAVLRISVCTLLTSACGTLALAYDNSTQCHCSAFVKASLPQSTIDAISELRAASAESRKPVWKGFFPHEFLKIVPGPATMLSLEFEGGENCVTSGGYLIADCGSQTLIALSFVTPPAAGSNIPLGRDSGNIAAIFRGVVIGPGLSGCFGISENGILHIVDVSSDSLVAAIDIGYRPISLGLFNPTRPCEPYRIHGTYKFPIRQSTTTG